MDVIANGINRNGSWEKPAPNSASMILNYRYDNDKLSEVGDKMYVGAVCKNCIKYIWNNRLNMEGRDGNRMAIGYYEYVVGNKKYGAVAMFDISADYPIDQHADPSLEYSVFADGGSNFSIEVASRASVTSDWIPSESFKDIYTFNDMVIMETNKNRYYFVYEEGNYTLLRLPERLVIDVHDTLGESSEDLEYVDVNIENISEQAASRQVVYTFPLGLKDAVYSKLFNSYDEYLSSLRQATNVMFTKFYDKIKLGDSMLKNFHCVCAVKMVDGEILMLSNVFSFVDLLRFTNNSTLTYVEATVEGTGSDYHHTIRPINDALSADKGFGIKLPTHTTTSAKVKTYRGVKVFVTEGLNVVKDLYDKGFVNEISVYLTDMVSEYDYNKTDISSMPYRTSTQGLGDLLCKFTCNLGINTDDDTFNRPFYKVGYIDLSTGELELTSKMFNGITNSESLTLNHFIDSMYVSGNNTVYNEMIHKAGVSRISKHYSFPKGDVAIDIKYKDNSTWHRVYVEGTMTYITAVPDNYLALEIASNCIEFNDISRIEAANLVVWNRVYRRLTIQSNIFSSVGYAVLLAKEDKVEYSGSDFVGTQSSLPETETISLGVYLQKAYDFYAPSANESTYHIVKSTRYGESIRVAMKDTWNGTSYPKFEAMTQAVTYNYTEDAIVDELTNSMQVSATSNPFVMPVERNFTFGDVSNVVIGCATTTQTISDAKYGQLPLYVITKRGVWVLETGTNDVAYLSSHNISPLNGYNAPRMVLGTPYGVIFMSEEGLVLIDSKNQMNNISVGMDGMMNVPCATGIDSIAGSHIDSVNESKERFIDFMSEDSFVVYDKRYGEIIIINPSSIVSFVYNIGVGLWHLRCDNKRVFFGRRQKITQYHTSVDINGEIHLIAKGLPFGESYFEPMEYDVVSKITEYNSIRYMSDTAACEHAVITTPIFAGKYFKVEHLIARFFNSADADTKYNIGMVILGSKSGVEWQIVGKAVQLSTSTMNSAEVRRMICSCRYVMFAFVKVPTKTKYDATRLYNYFSNYSYDSSTNDVKER